MAAFQAEVHVAYGGRTAKANVPRDTLQLRGNLAAEFDLLAVDVAGLARGGTLFPLSYIVQANREFLTTTRERPLELVVLGAHHRAIFTLAPNPERQNDPIITFMLATSSKSVTVRRKELELMNFVRSKVAGGKPRLDDLRSVYSKYLQGGHLPKPAFDNMMREFIQVTGLTDGEKRILSAALTRVFFAFDSDGDGVVVGQELLTALGTLVTTKGLAFAFRLADANGDGFISPAEFLTFTRAFLTLVLAFNDDVADLSADYVSALIDATTESVVRRAFYEADLNRDGLLTWSEFSTWYKNGGHSIMPWVSLMQSRQDQASNSTSAAGTNATYGQREDLTGDDTNDVVYEFALAPTYGSLVITRTDVDNLEHLLKKTRLYERDTERTLEFIAGNADSDRTLSKEKFDLCMKSLAPSIETLRREDQNRITYMLNNIFFAFDRTGARRVRADEFCTGFSLFCSGPKSTKLQLAYYLFDADDEGTIKALDFARFLRSVLTMLFALNDAAASLTSFQVYEAIDRTTARATRIMLKGLADAKGLSSPPPRVSFEDFANFYNTQSGNELISFVELLDLSKFPFSEIGNLVARKESAASVQSPAPHVPKDDRVVFSFDMLPAPERLDVRQSHSDRLKNILAASGERCKIVSMSPEQVHQLVAQVTTHRRTIAKPDYDRLVWSLFGKTAKPDQNYLLNSIFYAYDRQGLGEEISSAECACGLSMFCAGKKSDKLAYGFAAFDSNDDGLLTPEEVARFIRSFLTALFVLVQSPEEDQDPERIWRIVDSTSLDLAADVVHGAEGSKKRNISFEDFATWYGQGGFKSASFLELLDMSKWPSAEVAQRGGENEEDYDGEDDEEEVLDKSAKQKKQKKKSGKGDKEHQPVFVFQLTRDTALEVESGDIEFVRQLVQSSSLNRVAPEELLYALNSRADDLNVVHEAEFREALQAMFGNRAPNPEFALDAFQSLYELCDRDGLGCDVRELLGLLFLCSGSKSTKLAHCWNAVDADHDGDLTRAELFSLVRSFLNALFAFNYGANSHAIEDVYKIVDDASSVLAANIFLSARRKKKDTISFEEFAEFYSEGGGYRMAPWLELLNLSKFIGQEYAEPRQLVIPKSSSASSRNSLADDEKLNKVVFAFDLTETDDVLVVTVRDVLNLRSILSMSKIGSLDPEQVIQFINEQVDGQGRLTEQGFGTFVGVHVLRGTDSAEDEFVASSLYQLFAAFDRDENGSVDPTAFAVGLSLLASGSKSSKLSLGWALFSPHNGPDDDAEFEVGPLNKDTLVEFIVALLTSISLFAGNCLDDDVVRIAAIEAADRVFDDLGGSEVSFDGFASWYTSRGFEHLSWIELLANAKWKVPDGTMVGSKAEQPQQQQSHL